MRPANGLGPDPGMLSWDFVLNVMGSYQMILLQEDCTDISPFRSGQSLDWKETNSEPSVPIEKS